MEHHLEKIIHKKHFFIKSFIISLILLIIVCLIALLSYDLLVDMAQKMYGVDRDDYGKILLTVMGIWKILIIQLTLVPAIAMAFIEKHVKANITKGLE